MSCEHHQDYRYMQINITPGSFTATSDGVDYMRHEIAHWYTAPIMDAAIASIKEILGSEYPTPGSRVAERYIDHVLEECNVDLEQAFKRVLIA